MNKSEAQKIANKLYWNKEVNLIDYSFKDKELIFKELYLIKQAEELANERYYGGLNVL